MNGDTPSRADGARNRSSGGMGMKIRDLTALAATLFLVAATPAAAEPPVWVVRDADSTIVLFGSVHVLPRDLAWRPARLDTALASADDIWFETPVDAASQAEAVQAMQNNAWLPAGQQLSPLLTPAGRARLVRVCDRLGVAPEDFERMRPWLVDLRLGLTALARQGALASAGVEQILAEAAPRATRKAFERSAEQIGFFADAPMADQLASLEDTLKQIDEDPAFYDRLIAAWARGDTAAIETLGLTPMKRVSLYLYDRLIVQRNRSWTETIAGRLAGSGQTVVIVGAGHLVGPDSLPAMLRAKGFLVEGP
ncbi:MAG: TraB/GumN family protein [Caulobacter sp.]|nr:TraB/GumN family protein [Caulobacter sp.]